MRPFNIYFDYQMSQVVPIYTKTEKHSNYTILKNYSIE